MNKMTFQEAKERLKIFANGKYHELDYRLKINESGRETQECFLWVSGLGHSAAETWGLAFEKLQGFQNELIQAQQPGPEIRA